MVPISTWRNLEFGICDFGLGTWVEVRMVPISTWKNLDLGSWNLELGTWVEGRGSRDGWFQYRLGRTWILDLGICDFGLGSWNLGLGTWILEFGTWDLELGTWDLEFVTWDFVAENSMRLSFLPRQLKYTMLYTLYNTSAIHGAGIGDYLYA